MKKSKLKTPNDTDQLRLSDRNRDNISDNQITSDVDKSKTGEPLAASGLLGDSSEVKQWIDKCGTPVIYQNGRKRADDAVIKEYPISCWLSSLSVRLLHKIRDRLSRRIYGKQWRRYSVQGLSI